MNHVHTLRAPEPAQRTRQFAAEMRVEQRERWLIVSFSEPVRVCSWAIVGGGVVEADHVAWLEITNGELRPPVDPRRLLAARLAEQGLARAVGLLTSRDLRRYEDVVATQGAAAARCVATVGLGNAGRAGDPAHVAGRIGTINILVAVNAPLSAEALLEASAIATEAKACAVLESGLKSRVSGLAATGTGTDCVVIACPRPTHTAHAARYAGKHTPIGAVIGECVARGVSQGVATWRSERGQ